MLAMTDTTIAQLQIAGKQVVVIGPVPPQSFDVPRQLAYAAKQGRLDRVQGASLAHFRK